MAHEPIAEQTRARIRHLVLVEHRSVRAAARLCDISHTSAGRILADFEYATDKQSPPFSGGGGTAKIPPPNWSNDQPAPAKPREFDPRYHGHTFKSFASPLAFDGFDLNRIRQAISLHRQGSFIESSTLAIAIQSFGPIFAATRQRIAPSLSLPRFIRSGTRGLSRIVGEELRLQLFPSKGLLPSQYLPPTIFGAIAFDLIYMGFCVLQSVDGEPDPITGVRPRYTRRWPSWAVQHYRYRKTFVALTTEGPVDIINDGKFTLIANNEDPHMFGAIVALGEEGFDGRSTQKARAGWINKYGNPKLVGIMPAGVAPNTPEGNAFEQAMGTLMGPDGRGILPHGAELGFEGLTAEKSSSFKEALDCNWQYCAAIILGSDGTMTRGTGVYSAPIFAGVRRDLVDDDLTSEVRGLNQAHIHPYTLGNYEASIESSSGWFDPYLDIPLPDPDSDARIKSYADRVKALHETIAQERSNGFEVTQDRVNQLAESYEVDPPTLVTQKRVGNIEVAPADMAKVVKVDELRASRDLEPIGDARGELTIAEMDTKNKAPEEEPTTDNQEKEDENAKAQSGANESSSDVTGGGGTSTGDETKKGMLGTAYQQLEIRSEKDFDESKHPRRDDGKFGEGSGGGGSKEEPKQASSEKHGEAKVRTRESLEKDLPKDKNGNQRYEGFPLATINKVHEFSGDTGLKAIIYRKDRNGKEVQTYKYTDEHIQNHADAKFARAGRMANAISSLRDRVDKDSKSDKTKVADSAVVTRLIDSTTMRVGGSDSEKDTGSVGATTLRVEHVIKNDDGSVNVKFMGKSHKEWNRRIEGDLAQELLKRIEGKDSSDRLFSVSASDVNEYLENASPEKITAKDFRTFHATALSHNLLVESEPPPKISMKQAEANIKRVIESTAKHLGNTPSICKEKYINPRVLDAYRNRVVAQDEAT
jgi:hypothetical protein